MLGASRSPSGTRSKVRRALADEALEVLTDEPVAMLFSQPVRLGPMEWKLLRVLYRNRGEVVGRGELIEDLWEQTPPADPGNALDQLLHKLRADLGQTGALVETVRGVGVRLRFLRAETANTR